MSTKVGITASALFCSLCCSPASGAEVSGGWQPRENLQIETYGTTSYPSRSGLAPSGARYQYDPEGNGSLTTVGPPVAEWLIHCHTDLITDGRECATYSPVSGLAVFLAPTAEVGAICVLNHDSRTRRAAIRFDKRTALEMKMDGCIGPAEIPGLLSSTTITTRHFKGSNGPIDKIGPAAGAGEAIDLARFLLVHLPGITFDPATAPAPPQAAAPSTVQPSPPKRPQSRPATASRNLIAALQVGTATPYDRVAAGYVTSSTDPAVLDYILCLQAGTKREPGENILGKLQFVARLCGYMAEKFSAGAPSPGDIVVRIHQCGFRPGDARTDADC